MTGAGSGELHPDLKAALDAINGKKPEKEIPAELKATVEAYREEAAGTVRTLHGRQPEADPVRSAAERTPVPGADPGAMTEGEELAGMIGAYKAMTAGEERTLSRGKEAEA